MPEVPAIKNEPALPPRPAPRKGDKKLRVLPAPETREMDTKLLVGVSTVKSYNKPPDGANEDTVYVDPDRGIAFLGDGIGGGMAGERASEAAAATLTPAALEKHVLDLQGPTGPPADDTIAAQQQRAAYFKATLIDSVFVAKRDTVNEQPAVESAMRAVLTYMNERVNALRQDPDLLKQAEEKAALLTKKYRTNFTAESVMYGLGTTASLLKMWRDEADNDHVTVGQLGDSRIYRFRDGQLERLTKDHSLLQAVIDAGVKDRNGVEIRDDDDITREIDLIDLVDKGMENEVLLHVMKNIQQQIKDAARNRQPEPRATLESIRNVIIQSVGMPPPHAPEPFVATYDVKDGDAFLLVSDGVCDNKTDEEIREVLSRHVGFPAAAAKQLQMTAMRRSQGEDIFEEDRLRYRAKPDDISALMLTYKKR